MIKQLLKKQSGQAITEFAIALPTMVVIFLFSQYFYEAIQVKLKAQELARYTTWEFTGHALHDYESGDMGYNDAKNDIVSDAEDRFANLNSTDKLNNANKALAGSWSIRRVRTQNASEPRIPGGTIANFILTGVGYLLDGWRMLSIAQHPNVVWAALAAWYTAERNNLFGTAGANVFNPPSEWKFNNKGYIKTNVTVSFENEWIPEHFLDRNHWSQQSTRVRRLNFNMRNVLVADSWKLFDGQDVEGTDSKDSAFYKQVERMYLLKQSARNIFKIYTQIVRASTAVVALTALQKPLTMNPIEEVTVYSKNYTTLESGKRQMQEDLNSGAKSTYDTAPLLPKDDYDSDYQESLESRGENYMACPEVESLGCTSSLSQDNPFGDYIIPEEL
ncbi:MAG: pilus assembly protein [Deltaproteobacteria bacterium]|jgi:hypothetical protein|nr:pilus assembly protein [Deltaproteobacteria bacterium]